MPDLTTAFREPFLVVRAGNALCALPIAQVIEVSRLPALRPLATSVPAMLGLAILRGTPTPVLDLATLANLTPETPDFESASPALPPQRIVSVRAGAHSAALAVAEIVGIRTLPGATFQSISLPGGARPALGTLDAALAHLCDASRLIPAEIWDQLNTPVDPPSPAEVPAP